MAFHIFSGEYSERVGREFLMRKIFTILFTIFVLGIFFFLLFVLEKKCKGVKCKILNMNMANIDMVIFFSSTLFNYLFFLGKINSWSRGGQN